MKNLFVCTFFLLISCAVSAQYVHKIKADSVKITNDSCTAELVLENSTKQVPGFLYNKGNGRTEFRRAVTPLPGGAYLIGSDTLQIGQNAILNQYAQKQTASAWFDKARMRGLVMDNDSNQITLSTLGNGKFEFDDKIPLKGMLVTPYNGIDNRFGVFEFRSEKSGGIDSVNFRPLIKAIKNFSGRIGPTVWGNDFLSNAYGAVRTIESVSSFRLDTGKYEMGDNYDWPGAPVLFDWSLGANNLQAGQITISKQRHWTDLFKAWPNVMTRNIYTNGSVVATYNGWHGGYLSTYRLTGGNGTSMDRFFHFGIGTISYGSGVKVKEMIGLYVPPLNVTGVTNRAWGIYSEGGNDRSYFAGQIMIGDSSVLSADVHKFYVSGSSRFAGNILQTSGRTLLGGAVDDGATPLQVKDGAYFFRQSNAPIAIYDGGSNNGMSHIDLRNNGASGGQAGIRFTTDNSIRSQIMTGSNSSFLGASTLWDQINGNLSFSVRSGDLRLGATGYQSVNMILKGVTANLLVNTTTDDTTNKVQVNGTVKATSFISTSTTAPVNSADVTGQVGEIRVANGFLYAKDASGWKRVALSTF